MGAKVRLSNLPAVLLALLVTIGAWIFTVHSARSMSSTMPMPGGWSMSMAWMSMGNQSALAHAAMFLAMWAVMMVAMMLPSVLPAVLLHRGLLASRVGRGDQASGSQWLLVAGYFSIWVLFGAVAYVIGMAIASAAMQIDTRQPARPRGDGAGARSGRRVPADELETGLPAPLPLAAGVFCAPPDSRRGRLLAIRPAPRRVLRRLLLGA